MGEKKKFLADEKKGKKLKGKMCAVCNKKRTEKAHRTKDYGACYTLYININRLFILFFHSSFDFDRRCRCRWYSCRPFFALTLFSIDSIW